MSHLVLSRKLRPERFSDVAGQDHIVRAIQNSINSERLGHAYLFAGTRGVGKTTLARLFSKAIRCESRLEGESPCGSCNACENSSVDIIEIDGASNNSVENVRDLISNVQYLPVSGKFRVYIIDEVHMLSTSAFNALLKTLEEPPAHVKFVFATTDPQKLPDTVLSRCIRFDFKPLSTEKLNEVLLETIKKEQIKVDSDKVTKLIARCAQGSLRDALSLLEQAISFSSGDSISFDDLEDTLGLVNLGEIENLVEAIIQGQDQEVSRIFRQSSSKGVFLDQFCMSVLDVLFEQIQANNYKIGLNEMLWVFETLTKDFGWALESISPIQVIEVVLKKVTLRNQILKNSSTILNKTDGETAVSSELNSAKVTEKKSELEVEPTAEKSKEIKVFKKFKEESNNQAKKESILDPEVVPEDVVEIKAAEVAPAAQAENKQPAPEIKESSPSSKVEHSFEGLLENIGDHSPAMRTNLEHGNLLSPFEVLESEVRIQIGFKSTAKVFLDYFSEPEIKQRLLERCQDYFSREKVQLDLEIVGEDNFAGQDKEFNSITDKIYKEEEKIRQERIEELEQHSNVQLAENVFSSKVDKIVLTDGN